MDNYMEQLLKLFRLANKIECKDFNLENYKEEFSYWLSRYTKNGELYFKWLREEGILCDLSPAIAETGKGEYDSITINQNTTLISPYLKNINTKELKNKIVDCDFTVLGSIPLYIGRKPFDVIKDIDVYMTQNPYDIDSLVNWPGLYNYGENDVIIGFYGNIYDKDIKDKLRYLKIARERLIDAFDIKEVTVDDMYCYTLSTNYTKTKLKSKN